MRAVASNLQAKPSPGDDLNDTGRILAADPDVIGHQEIGGIARALFLKGRYLLKGMTLWATAIPTPIAWPTAWEVVAKGKEQLSGRVKNESHIGPKVLRAKRAPWVLLREPGGVMHFVMNAHLAPDPAKNHVVHAQQVDALAAKLAAVAAENPAVKRTLLGDLNTNDRSRLKPITDLGLQLGRRTADHGNHQLTYIASDLPGDRSLIGGMRSDHKAVLANLQEEPMPVPKGFMPGAIIKNIPPGSNDPAITPVGGVLHVAVSESDSLYPYFDGPSGGIESHFYVRYDGTIEQYRSIYFEADANYKGNSFMRGGKRCGLLSIENEGWGAGKWTAEQIASMKNIILWANAEADVPIQPITTWDGDGWGYHTMFGAPGPWTPHAGKTCPGPDRIVQFKDIFVPWLRLGGKDPQPPPPPAQSRVEMARDLFAQGLDLLEATPEKRKRVHAAIPEIQDWLDNTLPQK